VSDKSPPAVVSLQVDAEEHDRQGEKIVFTSPYGILAVTERRQEEARRAGERGRRLAEARRARATGQQLCNNRRTVIAGACAVTARRMISRCAAAAAALITSLGSIAGRTYNYE